MRERCEAVDGKMRCVLPAEHPGDEHEYVAALPEDVAQVIGHYINQLDDQLAYWRRQNRRNRILFWIMIAAASLNLAGVVTHWMAW